MKTADLSGPALDLAVAKCEFEGCEDWDGTLDGVDCVSDLQGVAYAPSTNWAQGGPIIEREGISWHCGNKSSYHAYAYGSADNFSGPTPLIAAMRCYCCANQNFNALAEELRAMKEQP